jgi:hypothetical protein
MKLIGRIGSLREYTIAGVYSLWLHREASK